jgi:hypothetical protein
MKDNNYGIFLWRKDERNSAGNVDTKEIFTRRKFRWTQCPQHETPCSEMKNGVKGKY